MPIFYTVLGFAILLFIGGWLAWTLHLDFFDDDEEWEQPSNVQLLGPNPGWFDWQSDPHFADQP